MLILKEHKGITLIALVITIIVLLILAGITIAMITGQDGVPDKAVQAKIENDKGAMKDATNLLSTKYLQEYYDKKYVQNDSDFGTTYGNQGAYLKAKLPTETEGGYTYSVSGSKLTVTDAKGNTVKGTINNDGTIIWKGSSSQATGSKIKVDGIDIDLSTLDATSVAQYYGKTVKTINNVQYGLFYVDYEGKYGEEGTVYLRSKTIVGTSQLNGTLADTDKTAAINIMKEINPQWNRARGNVEYTNYTTGEKGTAYLCNPNDTMWSGIGNLFNSSDLNYVIGAPSIEMFFDSYNAKYPNLTPNYTVHFNLNGALDPSYTYPGYLCSNNAGSSYSTSYTYAVSINSEVVYITYADTWLASPVSHQNDHRVYNVYDNGSLGNYGCGANMSCAPLISLKAGVDLTN